MSSGVYKITNKINGKFYIGSAINCFKRWCKKYNEHLESAFKKYGKENFIFEIIENVEDTSKLIEREQYYMDLLKPEYNKRSIASSNLGIKASDETRYKLSLARRKRITKPETCEKISASLKGREIKWKEKIAGLKVPRPAFSPLDISGTEKVLGRKIPAWEEGLAEYLTVS